MAYDLEQRILYTTIDENGNAIGISWEEIAQCLGDFQLANGELYDIGMLCNSPKLNLLSKYKPTNHPGLFTDKLTFMGDDRDDGYYLGYNCYGVQKPYISNEQFIALGSNGIPSGQGVKIIGVNFEQLLGKWSTSEKSKFRALDFDRYVQVPTYNSITYGGNAFVTSKSCSNPNGAIAASATLRYNWENIVHRDGKSATLGLKSLLACDGVNDKAYLGVVAYRTEKKTPNTGIPLTDIAVVGIHTVPLGEVCPNTGLKETHNVAIEVDDVVSSKTQSSVTSGFTDFYTGEYGLSVLPFVAKWSGSKWYFIGLGTEPYKYPGQLAQTGGSGSLKNTVVIKKVECTLTCVKQQDGSIKIGLQGNDSFKITVTGTGYMAFQQNNQFYITPADGNSILIGQTGIRLGVEDNEDLDLPGTTVSAANTQKIYQASSLMYGRSSGSTYEDAPNSIFKPYANSQSFMVGITIPYYRELKTWTYLNGKIAINPSEITEGNPKTYNITINA